MTTRGRVRHWSRTRARVYHEGSRSPVPFDIGEAGRLHGEALVDSPIAPCYNAAVVSQSTDTSPTYPRLEIIGLTGIPEIRPGDDLGPMILQTASAQGTPIQDADVVVVTQKIVSKAEGRLVELSTVEPSKKALQLAEASGRDPRIVELVLRESRAIVRKDLARGILITETYHGFVCANAGIDTSNVPGHETVSLLPKDPDRSAAAIRRYLSDALPGTDLAVVVSDTFGRAWRNGHVNFAIGVAGMEPMKDYRGTHDAHGKVLHVTRIAIADEIAAASEMVMAKSDGIPVAIVRGVPFESGEGGATALLRERSTDLFR